MTNEELTLELEKTNQKIKLLSSQIAYLKTTSENSNQLPDTKILSDKFLTRAFAILGHYIVASLIIVIPFYIIIFILALVFGIAHDLV